MRMRSVVLSSVVCLAVPRFSPLSHKLYDFQGKKKENEMCVLIFWTIFVWNISHSRRNERDRSKMFIVLRVKYPLFLSDFNETWIFSTDFLKYQISWKSVNRQPNHFMRMDGQADMTKLIFALRNFANMPKQRKAGPFHSMQAYVIAEVQLHSLTSALYRD